MKKLLLIVIVAALSLSAAAEGAPESYMQLKSQFKNMPVRVEKASFIKKQVAIGLTAGAVLFAMNEYFVRTGNEAFHSVMPYVAVAYALFQGYSILRSANMGSPGTSKGSCGGVTLCSF